MALNRLRRDKGSIIVVIDTSAIMMLFEFSIDLKKELTHLLGKYKIIVPQEVVDELEFLSINGKGKKKQIAKPALKLAGSYEFIASESKNADDAVINIAKKYNGVVFSNDKELRKKAKLKNLKTIFLRSKNHLMLDEPIV